MSFAYGSVLALPVVAPSSADSSPCGQRGPHDCLLRPSARPCPRLKRWVFEALVRGGRCSPLGAVPSGFFAVPKSAKEPTVVRVVARSVSLVAGRQTTTTDLLASEPSPAQGWPLRRGFSLLGAAVTSCWEPSIAFGSSSVGAEESRATGDRPCPILPPQQIGLITGFVGASFRVLFIAR